MLMAATVMQLWKSDVLHMEWEIKQILFLILAILFLGLLIYTLFFALPFEETYIEQDAHKTYDKKMYALCRHPGVLWFAGFYFCLWLSLGTKPLLAMAVWFSFLNFCYIVLHRVAEYICSPCAWVLYGSAVYRVIISKHFRIFNRYRMRVYAKLYPMWARVRG